MSPQSNPSPASPWHPGELAVQDSIGAVKHMDRAGRLYAQAMAHHGRELPPSLAHLADEGSASQEASSLMARLAR